MWPVMHVEKPIPYWMLVIPRMHTPGHVMCDACWEANAPSPNAGHVMCDACWEANAPSPNAGHVTCDACWEANPPVDRMTETCKNITLP